jgi:lipid-A-disaccharide synthase
MHAAHLVLALRRLLPDTEFDALGSHNLRDAGAEILIDTLKWGSIGIFEALKRAPRLYVAWGNLKKYIETGGYDLVIPVDYRVLNLKVLHLCRELGIPTAYYMAPVTWPVSRQGALLFGLDGMIRRLAGGSSKAGMNRYQEIADTADLVLVPFPFAVNGYKEAGANFRFTGHPLSSLIKVNKTPLQVRVEMRVPGKLPIVGLYPASRTHEIKHHLPTLLGAAKKIVDSGRQIFFYLSCASPEYRDTFVRALRDHDLEGVIRLVDGNDWNLMNAADLVVTKTGTICHEATFLLKPMVCFYTIHGALMEWLLRTFVVDFPFVAFPNVIAGREIVPELIQRRFTVDNLARDITELMDDQDRQSRMIEDLTAVRDECHVRDSVPLAAEAIVDMLENEKLEEARLG